MAYCINPDCSQRKNPDNCAVCQGCGTPLLLQNRYRLIYPLQLEAHSYTEVFEIEDLLERERPKVLKSLKNVTPDLLRLFEQEVSILTNLQHPGLPVGETIFPLFLHTNRQLRCFVMEKVPGENLQTWLSQNQCLTSYKNALDWLNQLVQILEFVHDHGFFHRDIKPANIILRPDGKLVLIDFGAARQLTQTIVNNKPVTVIISNGYTAPEQMQGQAVLQSDFYALGRTFIYLLTGIDPAHDSRARSYNWFKNIKDKKNPQSLIHLIQTMTDADPQRRPPTAEVILEKIANIKNKKYPQVQGLKYYLMIACGVLITIGAKLVYEKTVISLTCDNVLEDNLSCGEEILIPDNFTESNQPPVEKRSAIEQYRAKNFPDAVHLFTIAFNQQPDPETLIYLNNAKIQAQFTADKIHTIAVAVPLGRSTTKGLEILRGIAQAQTLILQSGQPLRILIADDHNRADNARSIAKRLVKYQDLLSVVGHYSSDATRQTLSIYNQAGVVLISATSTSDHLKSPIFFRTVSSDRIAGQKMATYLYSQLQQPKVAIFYSQDSEYAQSLSQAFQKAAKSLKGNVIDQQPAFNLARDKFDAEAVLNQVKTLGGTAIVVIPDAGVGLHNAIPNALKVLQSNVNQAWIVAGDSLYNADLLKAGKIVSPQGIERTALAIAWHPMNDPHSAFVQQAQILWKIPKTELPTNTEISWRTATSYDAVLVLSKAITQNPTHSGIQKTLTQPQFSVTGTTGVIQFEEGDRKYGTITMVVVRRHCNSSEFVFTPSNFTPKDWKNCGE
ncbi:protein kinase domain-containing protein [Anabaena sp. WFMT]|uniref:bifunctional serine/threonine-protein kinase/ABC transporter substrate-binding protein n=1 Tax=Anabaena sp. WFMT TaxID=3449730 RepID=UPI003F292DEF